MDSRTMDVLFKLCYVSADINNSVRVVPEYLVIIRRRMCKFLFNALAYNLNYKDLAHTNVEHMTNFFMYPLVCTPKDRLYPFYLKMFANTLMVNGGYLDHCDRMVVDAGITTNPFITRRDFDLTLMYFVITDKVKLTVTACRSYLFKGSYNPLADVYKCFLAALKGTNAIPTRSPSNHWKMTKDGLWHMPAPYKDLTEIVIKVGLVYCGPSLLLWTPSKIASLVEYCKDKGNNIETEKVPVETLISNPIGKYLIKTTCGLVVNVRDCHPYVYTWTAAGLYRFNSPMDYLYSHLAKEIGQTVCRIIE